MCVQWILPRKLCWWPRAVSVAKLEHPVLSRQADAAHPAIHLLGGGGVSAGHWLRLVQGCQQSAGKALLLRSFPHSPQSWRHRDTTVTIFTHPFLLPNLSFCPATISTEVWQYAPPDAFVLFPLIFFLSWLSSSFSHHFFYTLSLPLPPSFSPHH